MPMIPEPEARKRDERAAERADKEKPSPFPPKPEAAVHAAALDAMLAYRRSCRKYDPQAPFDPEAVARSLERAQLSPNSSNMQLWQFFRIRSAGALKQWGRICLGQSAAKTANELVVFVARRDHWRRHAQANMDWLKPQLDQMSPARAKGVMRYYGKLMPMIYWNDWFGLFGLGRKVVAWLAGLSRPMYRKLGKSDVRVTVHRTLALAAQTFMLSMAAEGYDTCPMEGFDSARAHRALGLPRGAEVAMVVSVGSRLPEGIYGKRFRVQEAGMVQER